jgi:hypothetical protein
MDIHPRSSAERSRTYTELREWSSGDDEHGPAQEQDLDGKESPAILVEEGAADGSSEQPPEQSTGPAANSLDQAIRFVFGEVADAESAPNNPVKQARRVTEGAVQTAILNLLADGSVWTNAQIKKTLASILPLSPADRQQSSSRPAEEKWEELVNNALTQSGRSNSLYARRLVCRVGFGKHQLVKGEQD